MEVVEVQSGQTQTLGVDASRTGAVAGAKPTELLASKSADPRDSTKAPKAGDLEPAVSVSAPATDGGAWDEFVSLFEDTLKRSVVKEGEIVKGRVVDVGPDVVLVDIGFKSEGAVSLHEFRGASGDVKVAVGDEIDVFVDARETDEGEILLSKEKADKLRLWDDIAAAAESNQCVTGCVLGRVKGGLAVDIGVRAFLPGSQVDIRPVRNLDKYIGERAEFKIIKFNRKRGNIVLSRRVVLEDERERQRKQLMDRLQVGSVVKGTVKNLTEYGAFVDLGGIDGLLHITDMSWNRIGHPKDVLQVGAEIEVKVMKFDPTNGRVSLGLKQLRDDPWTGVERRYPVGARVRGKVVTLTDYGAFVQLEDGVEGLIHISEMSWNRRIKHPSKVMQVGQLIEALVADVDPGQKRISLELKPLIVEKYPVGKVIKGVVRNVTDFGVFVGVEEGIDGLVHVSDLSWTRHIQHPNELYNKGDEIEAVVLNVEPASEKFSLSVKQLTPDPWHEVEAKCPIGAVMEGKVVKVLDFGAFVELMPGVEGLVHISEMSHDRVENPAQLAKPGETVRVMVIHADPEERRIGLSMKAIAFAQDQDAVAEYLGQRKDASTKLGDYLKAGLERAALGGSGTGEVGGSRRRPRGGRQPEKERTTGGGGRRKPDSFDDDDAVLDGEGGGAELDLDTESES